MVMYRVWLVILYTLINHLLVNFRVSVSPRVQGVCPQVQKERFISILADFLRLPVYILFQDCGVVMAVVSLHENDSLKIVIQVR